MNVIRSKEKPNLLYVDDERANLTAFRILLRDQYNVLTAENAEEAYGLLSKHDIPLVVSDQRMPGMSGTELLSKVANDFPDCARMILTGYSDIDAVIEGINRSQIYYYFKKPWNESEVRLTLENAYEYVMTRRNLAATASEWQNTFDSVNDVIWILDKDKRIVRCNSSTEVLFEVKSEDIVSKLCHEVAHDCPYPAQDCPVTVMKQTLKRETVEMQLGEKTFTVSVDPIFDASGSYNGAVHILSDITIRRQLEAERNQLEEHMRQSQKLEAIGSLAGGVAHDFNNLLTPIIIYAEMIENKCAADDSIKNKAQGITKAAMSAKQLTSQLLSFGRKQMLEMKLHNLNEVVGAFQDVLRRTIRENIEIDAKFAPQDLYVQVDKGQLVQIILNLIINAQDAIEDNGVVAIETSEVVMDDEIARVHPGMIPGKFALLVVSDNGTGMDEETLSHIFEPFYTTKKAGHGTGLGLATVYGIIKQHGGFVDVNSRPGHGTVFKIYLPLQASQSPNDKITEANDEVRKGSGTILVVDDNDMVREMLSDILTEAGYTIFAASTPAKALEIVENSPGQISLLLTDIVMPGMNGNELYEQISFIRPDLKVMYISGYASKVSVHGGFLEEGVNFLPKPFTSETLLERVQQLI